MTQLTLAEYERLAIISEECAEVQQVIGKILRHGFDSYSPKDETKETNREKLARELGDLALIVSFSGKQGDYDRKMMVEQTKNKVDKINKYLHYNIIDDE